MIFRGWIMYVLPSLMVLLAVVMLWRRHARKGSTLEPLEVMGPPSKNAVEQLLTLQEAVSHVEALIQSGNIVLLKLRALLFAVVPQVLPSHTFHSISLFMVAIHFSLWYLSIWALWRTQFAWVLKSVFNMQLELSMWAGRVDLCCPCPTLDTKGWVRTPIIKKQKEFNNFSKVSKTNANIIENKSNKHYQRHNTLIYAKNWNQPQYKYETNTLKLKTNTTKQVIIRYGVVVAMSPG